MKTITKLLTAMALALPFVNAEAEDYGFGDMGGIFNVSESGAATYTLPFDLPEGINGMVPSLGLVYNSQSGNGVAGMGISIYGISVITRTVKDIYHDGTAKGIGYNDNDVYNLDGVRLLQLGQADFRAENSPQDVITKLGSGSSQTFKINLQNGNTAYYNYTAKAGSVPYAWYLSRIEDKYGNVMYYTYTTVNGCVYLTQVQYGTNLGGSTGLSNIVTFVYESRTDAIPYIVNGQSCSMNRRLTSVTIKTNNVERNKYTLTYSNADAFSRLTKIEESYGTTKLPPVTLGWSKIPAFSETEKSCDISIPNYIYVDGTFKLVETSNGEELTFDKGVNIIGDVNGDGRDDLVFLAATRIYDYKYSSKIYRRNYNKIAFVFESTSTPTDAPALSLTGYYILNPDLSMEGIKNETKGLLIQDFDGDGINDIILPCKRTSNNKDYVCFYIANNSRVSPINILDNSNEMPLYTVADLSRNGKANIIYVENKAKDGKYVCGIFEYVDQDHNSCKTASLSFAKAPEKIFTSDFDGDGMVDLLILYKTGYTIYWNNGYSGFPFSDSNKTNGSNLSDTKVVQMGDFNGDGMMDFVVNNNSSWFDLYLNTGKSDLLNKDIFFKAPGYYKMETSNVKYDDKTLFNCNVIDLNNNGKQDLVVTVAKYSSGFKNTYTHWFADGTTPSKTASSIKADDGKEGVFAYGDFNGDGYIELVNYGYDCYGSTNANVAPSWHVYKNPSVSAATNKLTSISVGQSGIYTTISYSTLCDANVYTKGGSSTYPLATLCVPLSVVKQVYQNLAYNSYYTNYKYSGLRAHLQGRGLLGFTTVEANNTTTGEKRTTTVNSLNTTYYEPSKVTNTITKGGKSATTETTFSTLTSSGYKTSHFTYPKTVKETGFYGELATTTNTYDGSYHLTKQYTEYNVTNMYRQVEYSSYVGNKPGTVVTTQKHKDDANTFTTKTTYTYNEKGKVTTMVENASTVPVTHDYEYNKFGNMLTHKVSASGITTVTTTFTYDATNRFVASEKSSANSLIANYTYNALGRLIKKQEGVSGSLLTTSYTYDAVGNLTKITYPDNTSTTYTRGWGTMPYKRYQVTRTTSAQAPVITWYDNLNREVETTSTGEKGVNLTNSSSYDIKTMAQSSHNSKIGDVAISRNYTYNSLGELSKASCGTGQIINYSYSRRSVTATQDGGKYLQKSYDPWGNLTSVSHNNCTSTTYKYSSNGQPISVRYGDASYQDYMVSTMTYDNRGLQTSLTDIDAGKTSYEYDALGRVTKQTDARGNVTTNTYNASGLLTKQVCGGVTTTYEYDNRLRLTKETAGSQSIAYEYDDKNRLTKKSYSIDGTSLSYSYVYNSYGQMTAQTFPDGMTENYTYDSYGNLATIKIGGQRVWELNSYNGTQRTAYLGTAPLILTKNYSAKGLLTGTSVKKGSTSLHSFGYTFDGATGNLTQRTGMNGTETFKYDQFDRLNTGTGYALNGNIASKTGIGKYTYDANKKNAVVQVENTDNLIQGTASLTYNAFNKVATVVQGTNTLTITYGPDHQRTKTVLVNGSTTTTTLYADNYEQRTVNGTTTTYHYVASPDGLAAVYVKKNGTTTPYYVETDHIGSIINLFDASGTKQFSATYDAWGKQTITKNAIGLTRGYTGHEHWPQFGLIDMNGRFYDPLLGRFLSPDPYVQAPENPQNFNRYSYCLNNPLKYSDPDGEWILTWSISGSGFSIGLNFAPYPVGFGINVDWSNGFSLGVYGEFGERAGGNGLGAGIYADQGFSYNFKEHELSTFASEGAYGSAGPFSVGGSYNQNYNITNNKFDDYLSVNAGLGWGGNNYGYSLGASYTFGDNGGWSLSLGGNYVYERPTHEKEFVQHINDDGTIEFGNVTANDYKHLPDDQKSRYKTKILDNPSVVVDDPYVTFKLHDDCERISGFEKGKNVEIGQSPLNKNTFSFINKINLNMPKSVTIYGTKKVGTITHQQLMRLQRRHIFNKRIF